MRSIPYFTTLLIIATFLTGGAFAGDFIISFGGTHKEVNGVDRSELERNGIEIICEYNDGYCDMRNKEINISNKLGGEGSGQEGESSDVQVDKGSRDESSSLGVPINGRRMPRKVNNPRREYSATGGGTVINGGTKQTGGGHKEPNTTMNSSTKGGGLNKILVCDYDSTHIPEIEYKQPGEYGDECGRYVNRVLDNYDKGKRFGNTLEQKKQFINSQTPVPGSVMIIDSGHRYGHVALVKEVYEDGTILINDSNLVERHTVAEYILDLSDPNFPGEHDMRIEGYYVPYSHYYDVVIDRDGNGKLLRTVDTEELKIGLIGNHGEEPTKEQLQKIRELVLELGAKAYEDGSDHCSDNFDTSMLKESFISKVSKYIDKKSHDFINKVKKMGNVDPQVFIDAEDNHGIKKEVLACIAVAESGMGKNLSSGNNIMNYGNTDGGKRVSYDGVWKNVDSTAKGLSQGILSKRNIMGELSCGGRNALGWDYCGGTFYASSMTHWRTNTSKCLTTLYGEEEDRDNFKFKK